MKNTYETPKLIVHGTLEEITRAIGPSSATDSIFWGGNPIAHAPGSQDGDVTAR